jgi:hypothetical protein
MVRLDAQHLTLDAGPGFGPVKIPRATVLKITQRPGEAVVLDEPFDDSAKASWTKRGDVSQIRGADPRHPGVLAFGAGGGSIELKPPAPFAAGRLELSFHDDGAIHPGLRFQVELEFEGGVDPDRTITATLAWESETLAVASPKGPTLAVQRLIRAPGWRRLSVTFDSEHTSLAIDDAELAHGGSPRGPLAAIRVRTARAADAKAAVPELAATIDDLRLVQRFRPSSRVEIDTTQDDMLFSSGDQVFGTLVGADSERVILELEGRRLSFPWRQIARLALRRVPLGAGPLSGDWVRVEWLAPGAAGPSPETDQLEGVLLAVDSDSVRIRCPLLGELVLPRAAIRRLEWLSRGQRALFDHGPHHLGDREVLDLEPPYPESEPVEVRFDWEPPKSELGQPQLAIDVVQVEGVEGSLAFSAQIQKGELTTQLFLNDRSLGDLNQHVHVKNESPLRVRVPIPPDCLKTGENVLRFEQKGAKDDPRRRDNLGILSIAIEHSQPADRP